MTRSRPTWVFFGTKIVLNPNMPAVRRSSRAPAPRQVYSPLPVEDRRRRRRRERQPTADVHTSATPGASQTGPVSPVHLDNVQAEPAPLQQLPTPPPTHPQPDLDTMSTRNRRRSQRANRGTAPARFEIPVHVPRPRQPRAPRPLTPDSDADVAPATDDEDDTNNVEETTLPLATDPSHDLPELHYIGPMHDVCPSCYALHWKKERTSYRHSGYNSTPYSLCCGKGAVDLRPIPPHPPELQRLYTDATPGMHLPLCILLTTDAREFRQNIRAYNNAFAFTSMGTTGAVDPIVHAGGPPIFKIGGELYHHIGSLLPPDGHQPRYLQSYITDSSESARSQQYNLRPSTVRKIKNMLQQNNPYIQSLMNSSERLQAAGSHVHLLLTTIEPHAASRDFHRYNRPHASEVALLIESGSEYQPFERDIMIQRKNGQLRRVPEDHSGLLPMRFVLLLPHGSQGWTRNLPTGRLQEWIPEPRRRTGRSKLMNTAFH